MEVSVSAKKNSKAPVMIAPAMLVAAKVIARRITDVKTEPSIPVNRALREEHPQLLEVKLLKESAFIRVNPR